MALGSITPANWDNKPAAIAALRHAAEDPANQENSLFLELANHYREQDIAITALRRALVDQHSARLLSLWSPYESGLRSDPRFKNIVRDLGLVDYWRASGNWGDFCKPVGKDDFECR